MTSNVYSPYVTTTSLAHRQRFGQFFTEERVARFMLAWVIIPGLDEVYDPAFGLGAFYLASRAMSHTVAFRGSEVDSTILNFWRARTQAPNLSLSHEDYLQKWGQHHPAIVCNPPYMRFQKFLSRDQVFKAFNQHIGLHVSGYTNIASAFLMKSISELTTGGRLAYIMPLEFLNTGYGTLVKEYMLRQGRIHAIVRLDCEKDVFPDITTSIGIILFEKTLSPDVTRYYVIRQLEELETLLQRQPENIVSQQELRAQEKWLKHFEPYALKVRAECLVPLSTYGAFSRGIATGANEFFVLKPSQIASIGLARTEVVGCITKSSQVKHSFFTDHHWNNLVSRDAAVFLLNLNTRLSLHGVEYIRYGEKEGFNNRYLTRARKPWYRIESRRPAPIWFGVFSRDGYKVVRNYTGALNLTCFHGFQPNLFGAQFVDHLFLYLTSSAGRKILDLNMRQYGDSLDKFEPNDLNQALVPSVDWFSPIAQQRVKDEIQAMAPHERLSPEMEDIFRTLIEPTQTDSAATGKVAINPTAAQQRHAANRQLPAADSCRYTDVKRCESPS